MNWFCKEYGHSWAWRFGHWRERLTHWRCRTCGAYRLVVGLNSKEVSQ